MTQRRREAASSPTCDPGLQNPLPTPMLQLLMGGGCGDTPLCRRGAGTLAGSGVGVSGESLCRVSSVWGHGRQGVTQ